MLSSFISIPVSKPVIIPLMCLWPNYESVHMFLVPHLLWFLSSDSLKFILEITYWHLSLSLPLSPEYQSIHLLVYHMASLHLLQSSLLLAPSAGSPRETASVIFFFLIFDFSLHFLHWVFLDALSRKQQHFLCPIFQIVHLTSA